MRHIPTTRFSKVQCWRAIPSRFPPVDLFNAIAPPEDWQLLQNLEGQTNQRLRESSASLGFVRPEDRLEESSSHYIMGPLTHPNPEGSRFSDGTFGVLYAGLEFDTTVAEVKTQREEFLRRTGEGSMRLDMRAIVIDLAGELHDIRGPLGEEYRDPQASKALAWELREAGSFGLVFDSEARSGGQNVCIFRPPVLTNARQERHFAFVWDGQVIVGMYEYRQASEPRHAELQRL